MAYDPFWGVVLTTPTTSNADLAGSTQTSLNFDLNLYWVNEPANGGDDNAIYDNDSLDSTGGSDTTTGQTGEGVADTDGGPVTELEEIGVFRDSTATLANGDTAQVDIYAFRLADGRTVLRVDDNVMGGVRSAGILPKDVSGVTLGQTYDTLTQIDYTDFDKSFQPVCFANGTLIETANGLIAVEDLRPGMMVRTADNGFQPLRLSLGRRVGSAMQMQNPKMRPVRITAGALGNGLPKNDLRVSRQHRMMIASRICERMFDTREVLVPAIRLTDLPGIYVDNSLDELTYFHLVMDGHEVIFAEGSPAESLFMGETALESLTDEARDELLTLFPDAIEQAAAAITVRPVPAGARIRKLVARHARAEMPLAG